VRSGLHVESENGEGGNDQGLGHVWLYLNGFEGMEAHQKRTSNQKLVFDLTVCCTKHAHP
jgi:hypothetical protein